MSNLVKLLSRRTVVVLNSKQSRKMASNSKEAVVAVGQMRATSDKSQNMQQVKELVSRARAQEAKMLFLPECCDYVGESRPQTLELAEPLTGPTMSKYRELARSNKLWLSLGGVHELTGDNSSECKIYNAHVMINDQGEVAAIYRKMHLFDAETKDFRLRESDTVAAGKSLERPVSTPAGEVGLQICYDLRFAEPALILRKLGAQLLTYPAAFTYATGKAHWEILLRARAIETQCFVVAAAQQGWHNKKRQSWGHGMIINPWGKVLADCGGEQELAVATATIDLGSLESLYQSMPCFEHRRNDIYSLTAYNLPTATTDGSSCEDRMFAGNKVDMRTIFYESEHCFAFTNLRCVVQGHVLVSTKRITPRLNGLNCAEMTDLFATVCMVQRLLEKRYNTTSATVTVQDGADAGQTVPHVHFHVMPRRTGDFGHNDQIYVKLEERTENMPPRTLDERIDEAQMYRDMLRSSNNY
ncbi:nitrilase and fragile histidine triad fusion protein NitFhit [Scaptodrosophila lebanonensis]|uniref:Nitrilase and fragile histidine triad fusion protein NitFhit n=1 Tax=Drosophila lebanonensis TaxID=7225 RepID=A0A6J2U9S8_DROLE|nr:nitrilase and fragile histidine triad fusion protein NitFhit [Scaptodrosophila lebanonensis]